MYWLYFATECGHGYDVVVSYWFFLGTLAVLVVVGSELVVIVTNGWLSCKVLIVKLPCWYVWLAPLVTRAFLPLFKVVLENLFYLTTMLYSCMGQIVAKQVPFHTGKVVVIIYMVVWILQLLAQSLHHLCPYSILTSIPLPSCIHFKCRYVAGICNCPCPDLYSFLSQFHW